MENQSKTISFRIDGATSKSLENIKGYISENDHNELNLSDSLRYCVQFTEKNFHNKSRNWEEIMEIIKSYVTTAFFTAHGRKDLKYLDVLLDEIERANNDYDLEEVQEVRTLYNEEEPITLVRLLRFKSRLMPSIFLSFLGVDEEEYNHLVDDELADFINKKLNEEEFRNNAVGLFGINI